MKLSLFLVVVGLLSVVFAGSNVGYYGNPKYPGRCVIREDYIVWPGKHKDPSTCAKIVCSPDGMGAIHDCDKEVVKKGCKSLGFVNKDLPYPECCKRRVVCV